MTISPTNPPPEKYMDPLALLSRETAKGSKVHFRKAFSLEGTGKCSSLHKVNPCGDMIA